MPPARPFRARPLRRGLILPALLVAAACTIPLRGLPPGTTVETLSDMNMASSPAKFETFARKWPMICGAAEGAPVCLLAYEGGQEGSAGWHPTRQALVRLPGEVVCLFHAVQPAGGGDVVIRVNPTRAGHMFGTGLDAPLQSPAVPDAATFVRLCRDLATGRVPRS